MSRGHLDNEKAQARLRERQKLVKLNHERDLKAVMGTPEGRRLMYRVVFDTCHAMSDVFRPNSEMAYLAGQQAVGKFLWAEAMRVAPAEAVQAHADAVKAQQDDALHKEDAVAVAAKEEAEE